MRQAVMRWILSGALAAAATVCAAEDSPWGGALTVTSDYIHHGVSETCGHPAAQGDLHYRAARNPAAAESFAGLWASTPISDSGCSADEINLYAGRTWRFSPDSGATLSYVHYEYLNDRGATDHYDYDQLEASWAYADQIFLSVAWSPNTVRYVNRSHTRSRSAWAYGIQARQPLGMNFTLSAGAGYDEFMDVSGTGYGFWNAGVAYSLGSFQLDVTRFRTAARAERLFGGETAGERWSATLIWRF